MHALLSFFNNTNAIIYRSYVTTLMKPNNAGRTEKNPRVVFWSLDFFGCVKMTAPQKKTGR